MFNIMTPKVIILFGTSVLPKKECFHGNKSVYHSPNPGRVCRPHLLSAWLQGNLKQLAGCQAKEIWVQNTDLTSPAEPDLGRRLPETLSDLNQAQRLMITGKPGACWHMREKVETDWPSSHHTGSLWASGGPAAWKEPGPAGCLGHCGYQGYERRIQDKTDVTWSSYPRPPHSLSLGHHSAWHRKIWEQCIIRSKVKSDLERRNQHCFLPALYFLNEIQQLYQFQKLCPFHAFSQNMMCIS